MSEPTTEEVLAYFKDVREEDNLELDESDGSVGTVTRGEDPGTWVRAWVWCYDSDVQDWLENKRKQEEAS